MPGLLLVWTDERHWVQETLGTSTASNLLAMASNHPATHLGATVRTLLVSGFVMHHFLDIHLNKRLNLVTITLPEVVSTKATKGEPKERALPSGVSRRFQA